MTKNENEMLLKAKGIKDIFLKEFMLCCLLAKYLHDFGNLPFYFVYAYLDIESINDFVF